MSQIIAVGETLSDAEKNLSLAAEYSQILPAAGIYPTCLDIETAEATARLIRRERERITAIGEVGLDYWKVKGERERELQKEIFLLFVSLARELDLPLNVHSRSAGGHVIALLIEAGAHRVQLHAYDGKASSALPGVEAGFFFSIPPSVVRSQQKVKLVRRLPPDCILLESDSPVLGPDPGKRNEPDSIITALNAIAEIKGMDPEHLRRSVEENTVRLYGDCINPQPA